MIFIVIEHCNGEIMSIPKIITYKDIDDYKNGPYLIFVINFFDNKVERLFVNV